AAPRFRRRFLLLLTESVMSGSGPEHMPTDRRGIAEDPDPEDDHYRRRQLAADAELVTHEHDQGRDRGVRDERHHKDLRIAAAVQTCPNAAENGVQRCDPRDRPVPL